MFDATDLEITRRETAYEMGGESNEDRRWSRWYKSAEMSVIANGWDGKFDNGKSRGLDGNEYTGDGEPSDGYSGLDQLISGLLRRMPQAGQPWPIPERARWLQTLAMNLSFIHEDDAAGPTIEVRVLTTPQSGA